VCWAWLGLELACGSANKYSNRANYVKIGKNKGIKEKGSGRLAGGRQRSKADGLLVRFIYNGMVGLRPACVELSVSECSLNDSTHGTYSTHTQRVQVIGHEHSEDVVLAGSAEREE